MTILLRNRPVYRRLHRQYRGVESIELWRTLCTDCQPIETGSVLIGSVATPDIRNSVRLSSRIASLLTWPDFPDDCTDFGEHSRMPDGTRYTKQMNCDLAFTVSMCRMYDITVDVKRAFRSLRDRRDAALDALLSSARSRRLEKK